YAVASQLVETHLQGRRLGYLSGDQFAAWDDALADDAGCYVLKSHDADERLAAALREGRALALYAYRDLRDVAYSLMHKFGGTFEEVVERGGHLHICLANDRFWRAQPRVLCQRYETLVGDFSRGIRQIAAHLEIKLSEGEVAQLADAYSLQANRQRTIAYAQQLQ